MIAFKVRSPKEIKNRISEELKDPIYKDIMQVQNHPAFLEDPFIKAIAAYDSNMRYDLCKKQVKKEIPIRLLKKIISIHSYTYIKNLMFISLAINPTTYIVIFLLLGVVLKSKRWKRLCLTLSALLFSYSPTVHSINGLPNNGTRNMTAPLPERKQYTYGIVAGAATAIGTGTKPTRI